MDHRHHQHQAASTAQRIVFLFTTRLNFISFLNTDGYTSMYMYILNISSMRDARMRDHTCSTYTQISHIIIMMMKRKSLHVQAGGLSILWFLHMTKVTVYVHKGIYNNMIVYGWAEGRRYSGYFISTRTNDYGDDDDAIIFFFFIPSSGQSVSQCLLTKHRYRLQLNILIISLN